jgi:signal transduction histidine kinase
MRSRSGTDQRAPSGRPDPEGSRASADTPAGAAPGGAPGDAAREASGGGRGDRNDNGSAGGGHDRRTGAKRPTRWRLKNWRVRSRLLALIAAPTLIAVALSGGLLVSSTRSALGYEQVVALANLGGKITALAQTLEDERDTTAGYIVQGRPPDMTQVIQQDYGYSNYWAAQVTPLARGIGSGYPAETRAQASAVVTRISGLAALRKAALSSKLPPLVMVQDYSRAIDDLLALNDQIAQGSGDPTLAGTVRTLGLVSRIKEEASQQRAVLSTALTRGRFEPGELKALEGAQAEEASNLAVFNTSATVGQRQLYLGTVAGSLVSRADNQEQNAISLAGPAAAGATGSLAKDITTASDWYGAMSDVIAGMRSVESRLVSAIISRSAALRSGAITYAGVGSGAVVLVLLISVAFTALVARSMVGPLRQLRTGALEVAGMRLPEMVRRMGQDDSGEVPAEVEPIAVDSADEIGEVARAFDQVHREALRLAANEALLRGTVNSMFVNLSRRTQSLVERQLEMIDELEQGEADPERLESLFRMDHLATRMRRNSENLLVLAGHEDTRRRRRPVPLVDVLRAAVSEIEQYDRVHLDVQPGIAVRGQVVGDVVHLVSELAENATTFSPVETSVTVSGQFQNGGSLLLEITDEGIGMGDDELAHANWRLDNPPLVDVAVSRRMGLFVVGRLAVRNGIRVRLRPEAHGGLTALIWLPDELVVREAPGSTPGPRPAATTGMSGPLVRPPIAAGAGAGGQTGPQPVFGADAGGHTGPQPVLGVPLASQAPRQQPPAVTPPVTTLPMHEKIAAVGAPVSGEGDPVVVPPGNGGRKRLPIFESLESDWFRRGSGNGPGRQARAAIDQVLRPAHAEARDTGDWTSPGDDGWRVAASAQIPVAGGTTEAGLPKRVPRANLVPGSASRPGTGGLGEDSHRDPAPEPATAGTPRSAQEIRERLGSFQRGARAGHAAGQNGQLAAGEQEWEGDTDT